MTDYRCRLCTVNDHDALVEHLAEQLWESHRHGTLDDWSRAKAADYWQAIMRELATTAIAALGRR